MLVGVSVVLTICFIVSAISGVERGVQYLSNTNMVLAVVLAAFVFVLGPTVFILDLVPAATGAVAAVMLLVGGNSGLTGLQDLTIVAALPFVVVMIGLAVALVKDLRADPLMVRRQYAAEAVEAAVVEGVTKQVDDFTISVEKSD